MGIPAIPNYLKTASATNPDIPPGHRFNLLFPVWNTQFNIDKTGKNSALESVLTLGAFAEKAATALHARQKECLTEAALVIEAVATAPFVTGMGLAHPLENGFAFLNPYGLPYLPGSSIKGVLRQAVRELIGGKDSHWSTEKIYPISEGENPPIHYSMLDVLFGLETEDRATEHFRGVLTFHDTIPEIAGNKLSVEVMTPHQSHYYKDGLSPHDSGKLIPIFFLALPPKSKFTFYVTCDKQRLQRIAPQLLDTWQPDLTDAFAHAFDWLGFGAKTAVGYGAMMKDPAQAKQEAIDAKKHAQLRAQAEVEAKRVADLATMTPTQALISEYLHARVDKSQPELNALIGALRKGQWSSAREPEIEIARHVESLMRAAKKWKEKSEKKNPDKDGDHQDTLKIIACLKAK